MNEGVARIVQGALPDEAETLTWGAPENNVNSTILNAGVIAYVSPIDVGNAAADGRAAGKVELVR
jgi:hypothetical protein